MEPETAVTVTVKDFTAGLPPPPPHSAHATASIARKPARTQRRRRLLSKPTARTQPPNPSGSQAASSPSVRTKGCASKADVRPAAFTVSVALPPAVVELGEIPQAGMGAGPL